MKTFSIPSPGTEWRHGKKMTQTFRESILLQVLHLLPKKWHQHLVIFPSFNSAQSWTISTFIAPSNLNLSAPNTCKRRQAAVHTVLKSSQKRCRTLKPPIIQKILGMLTSSLLCCCSSSTMSKFMFNCLSIIEFKRSVSSDTNLMETCLQ